MRCPRCNSDNRAAARFCYKCGHSFLKHENLYYSMDFEKPYKTKPQPRSRKSGLLLTILIFLIIIILLGSYWVFNPENNSKNTKPRWDPGFDVEELITNDDKEFYNSYPQVPRIYSLTKNTASMNCDIIFEAPAIAEEDQPIFSEFLDRKVAVYNWAIEGAQVTDSIENLAQKLIEKSGSDRVEQAKAIFNFVAKYLDYTLDGAYEFPVTTLLDREGQCSEYATLLTSLYQASEFKTYYVLTLTDAYDYFQLGHIYIALYLPEYEDVESSQTIITSRLGPGWIGLDATENRCEFGELFSYSDSHSNIVSIVEPISNVTIYEVDANWEARTDEGDRIVHLDVYLKTWEAEDSDLINITFKLYEYGSVNDYKSFLISEHQEKDLEVELEYDSTKWLGKSEQYITISVN